MQSAAEGRCRCGTLRFRVTGAPLFTAACHCRGCRQMTASAFSLSNCYVSLHFDVLAGEPVIGGLHALPASDGGICAPCARLTLT